MKCNPCAKQMGATEKIVTEMPGCLKYCWKLLLCKAVATLYNCAACKCNWRFLSIALCLRKNREMGVATGNFISDETFRKVGKDKRRRRSWICFELVEGLLLAFCPFEGLSFLLVLVQRPCNLRKPSGKSQVVTDKI